MADWLSKDLPTADVCLGGAVMAAVDGHTADDHLHRLHLHIEEQ